MQDSPQRRLGNLFDDDLSSKKEFHTMNTDERFSRQRDIVPADRLAECQITVVGVGAIGRQVAVQLAAMGAPALTLIDFDTVEESNLASQGYREEDLGRPKVEATAEACLEVSSRLDVTAMNERFRRRTQPGNVLFCCVDKIDARRLIWEAVKDRVAFFADGRMTAEVIRILTACDPAGRQHYPTTLFTPGEAFAGSCTSKMTVFSASIAAGLMISQFSRWLRRMPAEKDQTLNLLAGELTCQ